MMSPWEWVSKYLMGRDSILWNRSTRSLRSEPCVTLIIRRLYSQEENTPMRKTPIILKTASANGP